MLFPVTGLVLICLGHQAIALVVVPQVTPDTTKIPYPTVTVPTERRLTGQTSEPGGTPRTSPPVAPAPPVQAGALSTEAPAESITVTILYDNNAFDPRLKTAWGFACLIDMPGSTILFDTGGDGPTLLHNMKVLDIDPALIEAVVLSHNHADHTGGLAGLLEVNNHLTVYAPQSFAGQIETRVGCRVEVRAVREATAIAEGIWTLGEMGADIPEQSIVVESPRQRVVVTGCAHPGIAVIARSASERGPITLLLGGFHLKDKGEAEIDRIIRELKALGVQRVGPAHCTGDLAISRFRDAFGDDFLSVGVGKRITLEP
jgi:7,8-dihydropterin-6-yl-methyl-4-(beta-D-ribofuranosyl)aminobenzene 5'-phosphate synthase